MVKAEQRETDGERHATGLNDGIVAAAIAHSLRKKPAAAAHRPCTYRAAKQKLSAAPGDLTEMHEIAKPCIHTQGHLQQWPFSSGAEAICSRVYMMR